MSQIILETVPGEPAASASSEESAADGNPSPEADASTPSVQEHVAEETGDDAVNSVDIMEPAPVTSDMASEETPTEVSL
jgi:hypothetical protein